MERTHRGFAAASAASPRRTGSESPAMWRGRVIDALNPASRRVNRSLRGAEFAQFTRSIERDLNPRGPLEQLVTRQAIRSAWRLKTNLELSDPIDEVVASTETERAARSLEVAITTLDLLQGRRIEEPVQPDDFAEPVIDEVEAPIEPNEWPIVPDEPDGDEVPIWQGRLVYDFDVSDHSPVIKGTWITVSHVVSLIIDGATWADILRSHPELVEADVRMCVAYAVAEENAIL